MGPGDFANSAASDGFVRLPIAILCGRIGTHLKNLAISANGIPNCYRLVDRMRERLFAINMLAALHRVDGNPAVPVVRGGDQHSLNILSFEQLAVIQIAFGLGDVLCTRQPALVHIADRYDLDVFRVAPLNEVAYVTGAHSAAANHADADTIVGTQHAGT